jgi:hypothetical protein
VPLLEGLKETTNVVCLPFLVSFRDSPLDFQPVPCLHALC